MKLTRRRRILLAAPFVILPLFARLAVGPLGDRIATRVAHAAPPPVAVANADDVSASDDAPTPKASMPRKSGPVVVHRAALDAGAPDAGAHGPIVVPATVVAQAIADKVVGARNVVDEDKRPLGARIHGVDRYGTGLRNGDVIVSVLGTPTPTTDALVAVGMKAIAAGATRLVGKILRDGALWDVVLEVPPPPKN